MPYRRTLVPFPNHSLWLIARSHFGDTLQVFSYPEISRHCVLTLFLYLEDLSLEIKQTFIPLLERTFLVNLQELVRRILNECVVFGKRINA
jgi:hypothetical protein